LLHLALIAKEAIYNIHPIKGSQMPPSDCNMHGHKMIMLMHSLVSQYENERRNVNGNGTGQS